MIESHAIRMAGYNDLHDRADSQRNLGHLDASNAHTADEGRHRSHFSSEEGEGEGGRRCSDRNRGPPESTPLPSIARLVEASAMLSAAGEGEGAWRYKRGGQPEQQAAFGRAI